MTRALRYLWRHPRRTGFAIFNLIALALLFGWGAFTQAMTHQGIAGVPNVTLGYTGMVLMFLALAAGWIAWAVMVTSRHAAIAQRRIPEAAQPPSPRV